MRTTENYLTQVNMGNAVRSGLRRTVLILSLVVAMGVFWGLKLTGITMAGEAFCGRQEHVHSEECDLRDLICEIPEEEAHSHSWECVFKTLVCTLPEQQGHIHEESCYSTEGDCICELEETPAHIHAEDCYVVEEGNYICGLYETEGHSHDDSCYQILESCPVEEHIHEASCYSDITADIETSEDWEASLADLSLTDNMAGNIIAVARSQLGYQESTRNFQVDELGIRRGITRYGQWYGNPYGDWSAMFAGFCLHYAGAEDLPVNAGPEAMRLEWTEAGLYGAAADFDPAAGYLLFLDKDANGLADAVAVITDVVNGQIAAIEGDLEDTVAESAYLMGDSSILGYGRVPFEPQLQLLPAKGAKLIARTEEHGQELFTDGSHLVVYVADDTGCYALDGNGEIAEITIDEAGGVYTDLETPELLLWVVKATDEGYVIQNLMTQMYLPEPAISTYSAEPEEESASTYQYARAVDYSVWLDGTDGGMMSYGDSPNMRYSVVGGTVFQLPETWQSPSEYNYRLRGWYDVVNNVYYEPGAEVMVNGNMVFYADWVAATYDIGQFNSRVANTVSTNEFVTTRMFDYGVLFNVLSSSASVEITDTEHTEIWRLITSGNSPYSGEETLDYIFRDWDRGSRDITYPDGVNNPSAHYPTDAGSVYGGLYTDQIGTLLFDPSTEVIGKEYLGTADHLFQLCTDPDDEHFGYYYYDSERNAASYNQSEERFYVYEYLEQTTVSSSTEGTGKYSDFLPFNSPYVNTNGNTPSYYTYAGKDGEYEGVIHYMYDATDSDASDVATNFFFGMSVDIDFYLPNVPGSGGNQDVYGKDMHFRFSGDDDVWVFVDGKMVLDLGGIHGMESGDVNFSSGVVTINGVVDNELSTTLRSIGAGEHILTMYYLERGSSMSNCAIYFNLAPRFSFSIQKEDVLTKDVLNGAEFSVYTDLACTQPAELWTSKASHDRGDPATHVFTVVDGVADMWGMGSGNTYYIKETKPPDAAEYTYASGIICLTIDKQGLASYNVELVEEGNAGISNGFTVHGFRIDEQTQKAYIVATNAPKWVEETTGVWAFKKWEDNLNHTGEAVTVYLTVTDPDGTVRRLQEAVLSSENNWKHRWENLPKYAEDGTTPIQYGVSEAYVSGYFSKVNLTDEFTVTTTAWTESSTLENGKTYILKTSSGCLSTLNTTIDTGFQWVSEETAKSSPQALWTVTTSGNGVKLTNGAGQTLTFFYNGGSSGFPTDFFASTGGESNESKQYFRYTAVGSGIRIYYDGADGKDYYPISSMTDAKKFQYSTTASAGLVFTPVTKTVTTTTETVEGWGYEIVNTPLDRETSLTVQKNWDYGSAKYSTAHEKAQVTVRLLADGADTGRTVTLTLKNGWKDTFRGLPYTDDDGNVIRYTVEESWDTPDWIPYYGEVVTLDGDPPTYSTTITNVYRWGHGAELPSTGSAARMMYVLCGAAIMLSSLVYGIGSRRKRERRMK